MGRQSLKLVRCSWAESEKIFIGYHDKEWGIAVHDDRLLFEMLNLEGAQAGLSWLTILKKRAGYKAAFDNFDAKKIAKYDQAKQAQLMANSGIVRNRLKINAAIENARAFLAIQKQYGSFDKYIWSFTDGRPLTHRDSTRAQQISEVMSKTLKKQGFRFVGPTICYAFMQAVGLINDHEPYCFRSSPNS